MSNHDQEDPRRSRRDAALEHAWRDASDEQPPEHLDDAILAAARKSVAGRSDPPVTAAPARVRTASWFSRWQPMAAAAAVAGLAFVLVQSLPREPDTAPTLQREESVSLPAAAALPSSIPPERDATETYGPKANGSLERTDQAAVADRAPAQDAAPARTAVPAPPPVAEAATAGEPAAATDLAAILPDDTSAVRQTAVAPETAARAAGAAEAAPAPARERAMSSAKAGSDPARWAERIAGQYAAGDVAGAADELREFRRSVPEADRYLPDSLREWARSVD